MQPPYCSGGAALPNYCIESKEQRKYFSFFPVEQKVMFKLIFSSTHPMSMSIHFKAMLIKYHMGRKCISRIYLIFMKNCFGWVTFSFHVYHCQASFKMESWDEFPMGSGIEEQGVRNWDGLFSRSVLCSGKVIGLRILRKKEANSVSNKQWTWKLTSEFILFSFITRKLWKSLTGTMLMQRFQSRRGIKVTTSTTFSNFTNCFSLQDEWHLEICAGF